MPKHRPLIFKLSALVLIFTLGLALPNFGAIRTFAMGDAPSTCANRYDSNFTSFVVENGTQSINVVTNPGATFTALTDAGYNVSFVLHTVNSSSDNNTASNGTTWYVENFWGFEFGNCVGVSVAGNLGAFNSANSSFDWPQFQSGSIGPDENVTAVYNISIDQLYNPASYVTGQNVTFTGWPITNGINYNVIWLEQTTMNLSCSTNDGTANCTSIVTAIPGPVPSTGIEFGPPSGTVNFTTSSSTIGGCTLQGSGNVSSCSLSFTAPLGNNSEVTAYYAGDQGHAPAGATPEAAVSLGSHIRISREQGYGAQPASSSSAEFGLAASSATVALGCTLSCSSSTISHASNTATNTFPPAPPPGNTGTTTGTRAAGFSFPISPNQLAIVAGVTGVTLLVFAGTLFFFRRNKRYV